MIEKRRTVAGFRRLVFAGLACVMFSGCGDSAQKDYSKVLAEVRKEPKVKEAIIDMDILYVTVEDNGSNRKGYAEYLCNVAIDAGTSVRLVKIFKVNSINDPRADGPYGILLGESSCEF